MKTQSFQNKVAWKYCSKKIKLSFQLWRNNLVFAFIRVHSQHWKIKWHAWLGRVSVAGCRYFTICSLSVNCTDPNTTQWWLLYIFLFGAGQVQIFACGCPKRKYPLVECMLIKSSSIAVMVYRKTTENILDVC